MIIIDDFCYKLEIRIGSIIIEHIKKGVSKDLTTFTADRHYMMNRRLSQLVEDAVKVAIDEYE